MRKQNKFTKYSKKINLLINSLLEKNLNKLNFKNLSNIAITNKVFITFLISSIIFFSYILIPHTYNKNDIRKELENQLLDKFSLNFVFSKNLKFILENILFPILFLCILKEYGILKISFVELTIFFNSLGS